MNRLIRSVLFVGVSLAAGLKTDAQPVTTLYSFLRGPINPHASLTLGNDGNFYGTTAAGGRNLGGTIYRMTTNGVLTTLFPFSGYPSGSDPTADLTLGPDGYFYGTTAAGGTNLTGANAGGVVFKMTTNGIPTTVVNFIGTNGGHPDAAVTLGPDGCYYGTTEFGGSNNVGTVFKVTTNGLLTTLVTFNNTNGSNPSYSLTLAPGGTLYGTTKAGGQFGFGSAFKLTTNGNFTLLHSFNQIDTSSANQNSEGASPAGRMALGPDGNLYGTTVLPGTAFQMTTNGGVTTLYNFDASFNSTNGALPYSGLTLGPDGNFYGTTSQGGTNGTGTIFQVSTNGILATLNRLPGVQYQYVTNSQGFTLIYYSTNNFTTSTLIGTTGTLGLNGVFTPLYSFPALTNSDNGVGADPESDLTVGPDGELYGTTVGGGTYGAGAVFKISTSGTFTGLASFAGNTGYNPYAGVTAGPNGSLYGVVESGGTTGYGTAYKVSSGGQFTLLNNFSFFSNGANPQGTLIQGPDGNFLGTAVGGGTNLLQTGPSSYQAESFGTVFKLSTNGAFTMLAYFAGTNGANPYGRLAIGPDGNFFGTTSAGGISNNGVVFELYTNGTLIALTNFTGVNGAFPYEGLTLGPDGNFYGTTEGGGNNNNGTVFQVTPAGALTTLVNFNGTNGANPNDALMLGRDGNLYGTTYTSTPDNSGTVFQVTTGGAFTNLYTFIHTNFAYPQGQHPVGGLAQGPDGCLYGTTSLGGLNNSSEGTLFKITTNGTLTTLNNFLIPNGSGPFATLTLQTNSHFINFYGTTFGDGSDHPGTVFRVNLTTSYVITENTAHTFLPLTNEVVWSTGGTLGLLTAVATNGTAQISGSNIGFLPATNFTGTATIIYTVTDNAGGTNFSFITVLVTNVPPVANPDFDTVAENSSADVLSPLVNDQLNTSGGVLSLISVSPTNGTAVISGTNVLFTPTANFMGTATIGYTITDNIGGTNSALITVTVANASADLSVTASAAPEPVGVGSNLVYSLIVSNAGPSSASGVFVSNQLPAGVNFISATSGATPSGGVLLVNLGSLAAGTNISAQIVISPNSAGPLTNLFAVFANETDSMLTNNSATVVSTVTNAPVVGVADVSISGYAGPQSGTFSSNLVYFLTVSNAGPATATGVVVSNQIPAGVVFISATGGATPTNGNLLVNLGSLAPGATGAVQVAVQLSELVGTTSITNVFQVFANQTDPNLANNATNPKVNFLNGAVTTPAYAEYDTNISTTVNQQANVYSTEVIAKLPNGTVVYDQIFSAAYANPTVQTAITTAAGDLTNAGATSYTGPVQTSSLQATNSASITVTNSSTNQIFGVKLFIGPEAFLDGNFGQIQSHTFDATATNFAIPAGWNGNPQVEALNSGAEDLVYFYLNLVTNVTTTTNTVTYTNSSVYVMTGVVASADVSISGYAGPQSGIFSSNLVYYLTVSNAGPATATGVVVSNSIPTGVVFISATGGATPTNGNLLLNLGSLAPGGSDAFQVAVQLSELVGTTSITNVFQVFANQTDPNLANNATNPVVNFLNGTQVGFSYAEYDTNISTTVNQQANVYSTELVAKLPNGAVVYDQTFSLPYSNSTVQAAITTAAGNLAGAGAASYTGPTQASLLQATNNVSVTITNSSTNQISATKLFVGPVTFLDGNFGQIQSYTFDSTITNFVLPAGWNGSPLAETLNYGAVDIVTSYLNIVTNLTTTTNTVTYTNSSVYVMTGIVAQADLKLIASAAPEPVGVNSNLVYSITITNQGPNAASGVTVSNQIPAGVSFVSATGGATPAGGVLLLNLGSLAANALTSAQVIVQPTASGRLTNLFQVFASTPDSVLTNNSVSLVSTVTNGPPPTVDVALSLTAAPNPVSVGAPLTYALTITNNSSTTATGVVVSNTLPPNVTLFSLLPSQGSATNQGNVVTYSVGSLPNGALATLAIVVLPNAAGLLTNTASVFSTQTDSQPANNLATIITTAVNQPFTNLVLTVLSSITLNPQTGLFEQRIQVANGGPSTPSSVLVTVSGLAANAKVYNATGTTNGLPYVQSSSQLGVGSNVVFLLEYYVPTRVAPTNLTLAVQAGPIVIPPVVGGTILSVSRTVVLANGNVLVEFKAVPGQVYAVQYSSDMITWLTAVPAITAPANVVQWIDAGPPQTVSNPAQQPSRYYRVVLMTAH